LLPPSLVFFAATEFGIYFTVDGGKQWAKLTGDVPTISFRDLAIQRWENDLVGASFGRSFYVFDDYSVLREVSEDQLKEEATLFGTRDAWWYIQKMGKNSQGAAYYVAPNPDFGAVFTYYLSDGYKTDKEERKEKEKKLIKNNEDVNFPGWDALEEERMQDALEEERMQAKPKVWLTVTDKDGNVVRKINGPTKKGFHRVSWNLQYANKSVINVNGKKEYDEWGPRGFGMVEPGFYSVTLSKEIDGVVTDLSDPVTFNVIPLRKGTLEGSEYDVVVEFWRELNDFKGTLSTYALKLQKALKTVKAMQFSLAKAENQPGDLESKLHGLRMELLAFDRRVYGDRSKGEVGVKTSPTINYRVQAAEMGVGGSTYGPTPTHIKSLAIAKKEFAGLSKDLDVLIDQKIPEMKKALKLAGAPDVE